MKIEAVATLFRAFEAAELDYWVDGGWGVDALLRSQTRTHTDLDLAVRRGDLPQFAVVLSGLGFEKRLGAGDRDWNPVFQNGSGASVDLHGFVLDERGNGVLGEPSENAFYPAGALEGVGVIAGMTVRCIAAPFVLMFRNGFEPREVDHHDVAQICAHFGLPRPSRFLTANEGSAH